MDLCTFWQVFFCHRVPGHHFRLSSKEDTSQVEALPSPRSPEDAKTQADTAIAIGTCFTFDAFFLMSVLHQLVPSKW